MQRTGIPRRERLIRLAERFPLYVPELYATTVDEETGFVVVGPPVDVRVPARPKRVWVADINRFPFPDDSPLPYGEAIFDRMAVEISRGCTEGCRFCQAGMIYRPVRERDPVAVIDALLEGVKKGGYDETSLTSLSTADYSCVTPLVKTAMAKLRDEKVSLSVSSLRAYGLNEDLLADMSTMKAQGLTFAPEAGTQRMRDVITKNVTEEDIIESAHRVFGRGFQRMKLYFMIGLPTETDEDVLGIVATASRVQAIGREHVRASQVTASVSIHVPKPHTPFQWAAMDTESETARKQTLLAEAARRLHVTLKTHENYQSHIEGIFSRGDREAGELLERAFRLGCRFDGWDDVLRVDLWDEALAQVTRERGFLAGRYLGTIPVTARLPWDHIDIGLEDDFLVKEYRKALKDRLSPPCGKPYKQLLHPSSVAAAHEAEKKKLVCYDCGVACDLQGMKDERLYFLRRMNAWTPPAPLPATPRAVPTEIGKSARPVTRLVQGTAYRYRLRYTKLGRTAYLGHLDLVRHLPRIFRRAGLELMYSEGFHPKPELSFGPALGLGIPSFCELLDVKLGEVVAPADLLARLNAVTLEGIEFLGAAALQGDEDRVLGKVLGRAEYAAYLPPGHSIDAGLLKMASGHPLLIVRTPPEDKKKTTLGRTIDVRRSLATLFVPATAMVSQLQSQLGWERGRILQFGITLSAEGGARPVEVLEALYDSQVAVDAELARVGLSAGDPVNGTWIDPLDLAAVRQARAWELASRKVPAGPPPPSVNGTSLNA